MFDRLRKVFSSTAGRPADGQPVSHEDIARWAAEQRLAMLPQSVPGHFNMGGDLQGCPWRLECGVATRDYMQGLELRGRADVGADPDAAVMVISRPLQETLEHRAYSAITDSLRTTVDASLPEEMRWLSLFEEVAWPELPASFRRHYAVVAEHIEFAQRWLPAHVIAQLLNAADASLGTPPGGDATPEAVSSQAKLAPVVLMLARGKVYLRMEHRRRSLAEVAAATDLLLAAAGAAQQHVTPPAGAR